MRPSKWVKVEWEEAAECFMFDLYFDTAPPNGQKLNFALGIEESQELYKAIQLAFKRKRKRKP